MSTELEHSKIDKLERLMYQLPQTEIPVTNTFTPGLYLREIFIPAGTVLTSKIHKTRHPYILKKGKLSVLVDGKVTTVEAPFSGITEEGTRRVAYAIEDSVWVTIHPNEDDCEDLEVIEERLIEKRNIYLTEHEQNFLSLCHGSQQQQQP